MVAFEIVAAILFVISSGLLFSERFRKNIILVGLAAIIAIISTYFLTEELVKKVLREERSEEGRKIDAAGASKSETAASENPVVKSPSSSPIASNEAASSVSKGSSTPIDTKIMERESIKRPFVYFNEPKIINPIVIKNGMIYFEGAVQINVGGEALARKTDVDWHIYNTPAGPYATSADTLSKNCTKDRTFVNKNSPFFTPGETLVPGQKKILRQDMLIQMREIREYNNIKWYSPSVVICAFFEDDAGAEHLSSYVFVINHKYDGSINVSKESTIPLSDVEIAYEGNGLTY